MEPTKAYSAAEKSAYRSPPCPRCGGRNVALTWVLDEYEGQPPHWLLMQKKCRDCNP